MTSTKHIPVMRDEIVDMLQLKKGMIVVDATLGGGGYTLEIYKKIMPGGMLIAIDADITAIKQFEKEYTEIAKKIHIVHSNYSHIREILKSFDIQYVDAIVADLGLSSDQIEETKRGFSFSNDGQLDMRLDQNQKLSAMNIVNEYDDEILVQLLFDYGDEKFARRIVDAICNSRPINSTRELANIIVGVIPMNARRKSKIHPATRTFQAIRIAVNNEFKHLKIFLTEGIDVLRSSGRFGVVSFHSGEDRLVKNIFRTNARGCVCAQDLPVCCCNHEPQIKLITKKPIAPSNDEIQNNPRSRSAKLRIVEKL